MMTIKEPALKIRLSDDLMDELMQLARSTH